jgi:hypothetical protein
MEHQIKLERERKEQFSKEVEYMHSKLESELHERMKVEAELQVSKEML